MIWIGIVIGLIAGVLIGGLITMMTMSFVIKRIKESNHK